MTSTAPDLKSIRFLAFVSDDESVDTLRKFARMQGWDADNCVHKGPVEEAALYLATRPTPDFLLVDVPSAEAAPGALDKLADVCDPKVKVIVTSTVDEYSFFRWLTDIGVHYYLLKPINGDALEAALQETSAFAKTEKAEEKSKLVCVMGTRGGVGASTVALNLAAAMALQRKTATALLDLEPQWGTLSLMLDLEPGRGLREALGKPDRIDALFMERVMLKYTEHLSVLSSEEPLDETVTFHPEAAGALLQETRKKYPFIYADLHREITPFTQMFLKESDSVIIVTELNLISLRDAMRLHDYLRDKLEVNKVLFVANRQGLLPKQEMPVTDFEKSLGAKFTAVIPYDAPVYSGIASGELPVEKKPPTAFAKHIFDLHALLHPAGKHGKEAQKTSGLLGWLKRKG